jgi:hypothetical protein
VNAAILHKKVLGLPVWAVGGLGAGGVILYHFVRPKGVGGAQADTTPPTGTGDTFTGDPVPSDGGTFPQTYPQGGGSSGGSAYDSGGADAIAAGFASLGDLLTSAPPPPDYSAQIADLTATVGTLVDQEATSHAPDAVTSEIRKVEHKPLAHKAAAVHAKVPPARGGHAAAPKAKPKPAAKPAAHKPTPVHPKAPVHKASTKRNAK